MSAMQKILRKNTSYLAISEGISILILFFVSILIARKLGQTVYGQFAFVLAFAQIWQVIADFGLTMIAIRDISINKNDVKKILSNFFSLKIVIGFITYGLIVISTLLLNKPKFIKELIIIAGAYLIIYTLAELLRSIFKAYEKFKYEAFIKISQHLFLLALIIYAVLQKSLTAVVWSYFIAATYALVISIIIIKKKFTSFGWQWNNKIIKNILKQAWPLALANMFVIIYFRIDTVMLSIIKGDQPTAWYNAAYLLIFSLTFVAYVLIMSVYPKLSQLAKESLTACRKLYRQTLYLMTLAGLLILGITTAIAKWLIIYIYGIEFSPAVNIFYILSLAVFFSFLAHVWLYTLNALGKQLTYTLATGLGMIINIVLNFYWIPKFSYLGAAWATVLTEIISGLIIFGLVEYYLNKKFVHINSNIGPNINKPL